METITVGDLSVPRMGFGAMRITGKGVWGPPEDRGAALSVLRRVVELGVRFIDTADAYGPDVSEELIAEALHPYGDGVVVATKGGLTRSGPGRWDTDGRPEHLRAACDGSLRRLKVDRIDVYQLHSPDAKVPFADSVGTLAELKAEGKVRHVGLSNVSIGQLAEARAIVDIVSVQNRYNINDRASEDVLRACEADGLAFLPWFPLAAGDLTKPDGPLDLVAKAHQASVSQVVLAWLLHRSPVMVPIPGTSSVAHLEENVAASSLCLTSDELEAIEQAARAEP